jgi:septal ring factor EnvC (AmiA/AmiB activator)
MRKADLDEAVFSYIRAQMDVFLDMEKSLHTLLAMKKAKLNHSNTQQEIVALRKKLDSKQSILSGLYVDLKEGFLSQEDYAGHRAIITEDIEAIKTHLAELESAKNETQEQLTGELRWRVLVQRFYDATEMTQEMADAFIESMKLHKDNSLEIKLSYMDEFAALMNACQQLKKEVA